MQELKIDPEFRDKIPPPTQAQIKQLEENILQVGKILDSIKTWHGFVIDGHHRLEIYKKHPELPEPAVESLDDYLPDRYAVTIWICKNQIGQRNLNEFQFAKVIAIAHEAQKKTSANAFGHEFHGNQHTKEVAGEIAGEQVPGTRRKSKDGTIAKIADEFNLPVGKVSHAVRLGRSLEEIERISPEVAAGLESGEIKANKSHVEAVRLMEPEAKKEAVEKLKQGRPIKELIPQKEERREKYSDEPDEQIHFQATPHTSDYNGGGTKEYREERKQIAAIVADMYDPSTAPEYTVSDMVDEIKLNAEQYIGIVMNVLSDRSIILTDENRPIVAEALDEVIEQMKKIRKLVKDESVS